MIEIYLIELKIKVLNESSTPAAAPFATGAGKSPSVNKQRKGIPGSHIDYNYVDQHIR